MKTIAVDIDDVLALSAEGFVIYSNELYGTDLRPEDYDEHWAKVWKVSNEEAATRSECFSKSGAVKTFRPIADGEAVLRELSREYNLVIVTSRRLVTQSDTLQWINYHYPQLFTDIHYAGMWDNPTDSSIHATKREVCEQIGADYLIDDQLKHCQAVAEAGMQAVLFGNYTWNQSNILFSGVVRCADWQEVKSYFERQSI